MDIAREIFAIIAEHVNQRNSYGHTYKETAAWIDIAMENIRNARLIFNYSNAKRDIWPKENMLRKKLSVTRWNSLEYSEVAINSKKPQKIKVLIFNT